MPSVPSRRLASLFVLATLAVGDSYSAEVRLKSGDIYPNATILSQDATSIEIQVQHGTMTLPLSLVATIDGRSVPVLPRPAATVPPQPPPTTSKPAVRPAPSPAASRPSVPAAATPRPAVRAPLALPLPAAQPARTWTWQRLTLILLGLAGAWAWTVYLVWKDQRAQQKTARSWWVVAAVLPFVGYVVYRVVGGASQRLQSLRIAKTRAAFELLDADHHPVVINVGEEVTGIENAKGILEGALQQRASDVHIEPSSTECRVRFRIDGTLYPRAKLNPENGLRLISALKSLAQMDISERRRAQDGRFAARTGTRTVDFRLATTPSVHGEKLVIRILDRNAGLRGLDDLGMPEHLMKSFSRAIHSRAGMILVTGPTGSGKTSTLYAALSQLDSVRLNLVTIEDPVEYELGGATQIPVNPKTGVTFESGLRSILRQDPDVIFVGEMRDFEAAQIALRSALTGHLVFSSLHTRDAIGTIARLEEMGIERHLLSSALIAVVAQRLVRVLCRACRQPYPCEGTELHELGFELPPGETIYRAAGCRKCEGTGYVGRTGVFEVLVLDEDLRSGVTNGPADDAFVKLARSKGFQGYREEAAQKVLLGVTSAEEVLKAN